MKKFLLLLILAMPFAMANAQDTITHTDGKTTQAKVLLISQQEIQYKLWDFQEGPTYSLPKDAVHSIKFSNGLIQTFTDTPTTIASTPPTTTTSSSQDIAQSITNASTNISNSINTTGGKISTNVGNIAKQQDLYARARVLNAIGIVTFSGCLIGGVVWAAVSDIPAWIPVTVGTVGAMGCCIAFAGPAAKLKREAEELSSSTLMQYNINDNIALDVRGFNYRPTDTKCYGLGVSLTF